MSELSKSATQQFYQMILIHRTAKESETRTFLRLTTARLGNNHDMKAGLVIFAIYW